MIVMLLGISMLTACNNGAITLDKLQNEYGVVIEGGGFEEGSTLISNEIAESRYCEKRRAMRKVVVDIGVLNHTFFGRTKSIRHPPGCHTSGAEKISLVWHSSDEQNTISKNWRKTI